MQANVHETNHETNYYYYDDGDMIGNSRRNLLDIKDRKTNHILRCLQ